MYQEKASRLLLLSFCMLFILFHGQLMMEQEHDTSDVDETSSESESESELDDDEEEINTMLAIIHRQKLRRCWIDIRSSHWADKILSGEILLGHLEFEHNFRMLRNSFEQLHALLGMNSAVPRLISYIELYITLNNTRWRLATPSRIRLLVFLRHVMQGANYRVLSNKFALGVSNISKCIHDVTDKILRHMFHMYICLLRGADALQNMYSWQAQTGIPNIFGAIDGTHFTIKRPSQDHEVFFDCARVTGECR